MPATLGQAELLAQVAYLYFEAEQDQGAIARRLHSSRSSVSRLLNQARQQGIVEIRINYPLPLAPEVAAELQSTFGLKEARILKTTRINTHEPLHYLSLLAAKFLEENLR